MPPKNARREILRPERRTSPVLNESGVMAIRTLAHVSEVTREANPRGEDSESDDKRVDGHAAPELADPAE
jgi:hypothetical protein